MLSFRCYALSISALFVCQSVSAQVMVRELGDFSLKLVTSPTRSMAQGLVTQSGTGSFHGGLDLTHDSGFYFGQWTPNAGVTPDSTLEVDSYMGFKKPFDQTLGYEMGVVRYTYPDTSQLDTHEFYAGLRILDSRVGAAFSDDVGRRDSTLIVDLGGIQELGLGIRVQYANHQYDAPQVITDGGMVTSFNDWSLNISKPWMGIDMNLIYSGSSLTGADCSAYSGHNTNCDSTFTLKAVRSFF